MQANLREDYRAAAAELVAAWEPGDRFVAVTGTVSASTDGALLHYLRERPDVLAARIDEPSLERSVAAQRPFEGRLHVIYRARPYAEARLAWVEQRFELIARGETRFGIDHRVFKPR